jgi:penicillin-binding protein 1C
MAARSREGKGVSLGRGSAINALLLTGFPAILAVVLLAVPWPALDRFVADPAGTRITDRTGVLLAITPGREGSFQLAEDSARIPPDCEEIFIRLEDARFYVHPGVDALAFVRSLANRVLSPGAQSGASTITMQLARMVSPRGRSVGGKIVEMLEALRITALLPKDRVLALYLNAVPFGRNTRGVGAAAWTYFGKDLGSLNRAQILALAVIPRNPTLFDPFDHPDRLIATARELAFRNRLGIAAAEIEAAVRSARGDRPDSAAPHFARYVSQQVASGALKPVGGELRTQMDLSLNKDIETRVRFILDRYAAARVTNAAVVVIDNATGGIVGWVGSRDFNDDAHAGQLDGVLIRRQSASTLKPFLYASAIQKGWTAASLVPDVPIVFGAADEEAYSPENFDKRSHGVVRVRTALASSLNVPAVYTLSRVGLSDFLGTLADLYFTLPADAAARYGLGTAIGNAEVSLLELARAFSVFPRGGTVAGSVVQAGVVGASRRLFDPFTAWIICDILSDPSARATGFGTHTYFKTPFPAMFKSGTSSEFTNLWCLGATPQYTVGVWAGNFDGRTVINKTGSIVPTQIVTDVLTELADKHPVAPGAREFARPANAVAARVCTISGEKATAACTSTRVEYFRNQSEVPQSCVLHGNPGSTDTLLQESFLAMGEDVRILFPANGQVFYRDQTVSQASQGIPLVVASRPHAKVSLSIDGLPTLADPSSIAVSAPLTRGDHTIIVHSGQGSDRVSYQVK